jgi:hypothetical protein
VRLLGDLLAWTRGPTSFHDELSWLPIAVGALSLATIGIVSYLLFRPLGPPTALCFTLSKAAR